MKKLTSLIVFMLITSFGFGQIVNDLNKVTVPLDDGTKVTLYGKAYGIGDASSEDVLKNGVLTDSTNAKDGEYYYLPSSLKLSKNENGIPQFLLLKYMADEETPDRDMSGAIMHFLMEWGLTGEQRKECERKLKDLRPNEKEPKIVGPITVAAPPGESFGVTSAIASDESFNNSGLIASGSAPVIEGGKVAVAANFNKYGAQLIGATFDKPSGEASISDLSVTLAYQYQTKIPAIKGRVIFDWSKFAFSELESSEKYTQKGDGTGKYRWRPPNGGEIFLGLLWPKQEEIKAKKNSYEYTQKLFEFLSQNGMVTMELEENVDDERLTVIREAILNLFMNSINQMFQEALEQESSDDDARFDSEAGEERKDAKESQKEIIDRKKKESFEAVKTVQRMTTKKGRQIIQLNYGLTLTRTFTITENIMSWYDDIEKYNDACISKVLLNDPFFQRLRIQFILDKDMVDIFEQEVNYATVNIKKERNDGHPFTARVTLDNQYIKEKGIQAAVTYAAGADKNPDMYEYQVQYSFRGGNVFPEKPRWKKGTMEAVTLYPPIKMHTIEFESDLDEMKEYNLARATMQVRYKRLGQEYQANIPVSPAKKEPIVSKSIFMDQDMNGFAYRIIYDHKKEGKLATEWNAKLGSIDYVYGTIPPEFRDPTSEAFKKAKEIGSTLNRSESKEGKVINNVLDSFKILFN